MFFVVGLGNPGAKYEGTRHNVGFEVVDRLARRAGLSISDKKFKARIGRGSVAGQDCLLMMPQTYMNLSGESVGPAVGFFKGTPERVIVVHDELDLPPGLLRLKRGGGHGGHNGLKSISQQLGPNYGRLRVGIGRPPPRWDTSNYVLGKFSPAEWSEVEPALDDAVDALETWMSEGLDRAMNRFHRPTDAKAP